MVQVACTVLRARDLEPFKLCRVVGFKGGQEVTVVPVMMMMMMVISAMEGFIDGYEDAKDDNDDDWRWLQVRVVLGT